MKTYYRISWVIRQIFFLSVQNNQVGRVAQSVGHLTRKSWVLGLIPVLVAYFRLFFRLFQEGQLSVTGKSKCTKYWLTA